jgi:osmotically-inducible protein OsmY
MIVRHALAAAVTAVALLATTGCSVVRDQQSVGAYVDDTTLTTRVKAKFAEDPTVRAMAISVETFNGLWSSCRVLPSRPTSGPGPSA